MPQFRYGVLPKRCGGSLRGQEERAKIGHPFGIGHLQGVVLSRLVRLVRTEKEKQTFDLVPFVYGLLE